MIKVETYGSKPLLLRLWSMFTRSKKGWITIPVLHKLEGLDNSEEEA